MVPNKVSLKVFEGALKRIEPQLGVVWSEKDHFKPEETDEKELGLSVSIIKNKHPYISVKTLMQNSRYGDYYLRKFVMSFLAISCTGQKR